MGLENIIPWGRSLEEYQKVFGLPDDDLNKKILGCGDGSKSFNAEETERGCQVISCDPVYHLGLRKFVIGSMRYTHEIMAKMQHGDCFFAPPSAPLRSSACCRR